MVPSYSSSSSASSMSNKLFRSLGDLLGRVTLALGVAFREAAFLVFWFFFFDDGGGALAGEGFSKPKVSSMSCECSSSGGTAVGPLCFWALCRTLLRGAELNDTSRFCFLSAAPAVDFLFVF